MTLVTKNCLEYNITVITKLHSKFELDLNKFSLSLNKFSLSRPLLDRPYAIRDTSISRLLIEIGILFFHIMIELAWLHHICEFEHRFQNCPLLDTCVQQGTLSISRKLTTGKFFQKSWVLTKTAEGDSMCRHLPIECFRRPRGDQIFTPRLN